MLIDTHAHIVDEQFDNYDQIVENFVSCGGYAVINMGCNHISSEGGKNLAEKHDSVYFGAGFHPSDIEYFSEENFNKVKELALHKKCVAIGEIGLDYHFEPFDKEKQKSMFTRQLEFASSINLPISIHSRDATEDMINILQGNKSILNGGATMHCFSGSKETAKILLDLGLYISFGGTVTFKNANKLLEVAKYVPKDRILTETDCPYLSPTPLRGTKNEPKNVKYVLEFLSSLRGESIDDFSEQIKRNTLTLFTKINDIK